MEQTASRLLRNAGSWYEHGGLMTVILNEGEVLELVLVLEVIHIILH